MQRGRNPKDHEVSSFLDSQDMDEMSEISQNLERVRRYQERKQALSDLAEHKTEENLWKCAEKKLRGSTIHPAAAGKSKPRFAASVPPKEHPREKQQ